MNSYRNLFAVFFAACFMTVAAFAADESAKASAAADASPAGTWKWTQSFGGGGQSFERKIQFDYKDGKLTGKMLAGEGAFGATPEAPISDGSFKDGMISFSITRDFNGQSFTIKYSGKLEGDTIKGSAEFPSPDGGDPRKLEWNPSRVK